MSAVADRAIGGGGTGLRVVFGWHGSELLVEQTQDFGESWQMVADPKVTIYDNLITNEQVVHFDLPPFRNPPRQGQRDVQAVPSRPGNLLRGGCDDVDGKKVRGRANKWSGAGMARGRGKGNWQCG